MANLPLVGGGAINAEMIDLMTDDEEVIDLDEQVAGADRREVIGDNEKAHILEDEVYCSALRAIAEGADNPRELAAAALAAREIDYHRSHPEIAP